MKTRNAKIKSTFLGVEDHGILTAYLNLDYDEMGQSFGGYCFGAISHPVGNAFGMEFIRQLLRTLEVDTWEQIPGEHCRVKQDDNKVYSIGHITKNKWFDVEKIAKEYRNED